MGLFLTSLKKKAKSQVNKTLLHVFPNSDSASFFFFFLPPVPLPPFEVVGAIALVFLLIQQEGENQGTEADLLIAMESRYLKDCDTLGFLLYTEVSDIDIENNKLFCKRSENEFLVKVKELSKNTGYLVLFEFFHTSTVLLFNT